MSGGPAEAGTGKLVFIVGGDGAVLERCRPVLGTLGTEVHHVGPLGSGQVVKIVNNMMSMANVAIAAEAMVLGVKAGMDPGRLFDILSTSGGRSHHFLKRFPNVLAGDFTPRFGIGLSRKDLSLAMALAARLEMPLLVTSAVRQVYEAAHAQGLGDLDMAGVIRLYEHWTGVTVRAKAHEGEGRTGSGEPRSLTIRPLQGAPEPPYPRGDRRARRERLRHVSAGRPRLSPRARLPSRPGPFGSQFCPDAQCYHCGTDRAGRRTHGRPRRNQRASGASSAQGAQASGARSRRQPRRTLPGGDR